MTEFWRKVLPCVLAGSLLGAAGPAAALESSPPARDVAQILASDLPKEGQDTLALIRKGGPYPYTKDGSVFSNRERLLSLQPRGFYREFTVKTPHSRDRGARRIICGGNVMKQQAQVLETCYYTDDHYASFKKIKE